MVSLCPGLLLCRSVFSSIDYRCADGKEVGELRGDIGVNSIGLIDSLFHKTHILTLKNEQLSHEMHLRILRLSIGLKFSNPGCIEKLLLHLLVKQVTEIDF
jgi:hypothetical protein